MSEKRNFFCKQKSFTAYDQECLIEQQQQQQHEEKEEDNEKRNSRARSSSSSLIYNANKDKVTASLQQASSSLPERLKAGDLKELTWSEKSNLAKYLIFSVMLIALVTLSLLLIDSSCKSSV